MLVDVPLQFEVERFGVYEFIGIAIKTPVDLFLDEIDVAQLEPNFVFETNIISLEGL